MRPKSEIYTPKRDDEHRAVSLSYGSTPGTNCMGLSEEHHPFPMIFFSISPSQDYLKLSLSARKKVKQRQKHLRMYLCIQLISSFHRTFKQVKIKTNILHRRRCRKRNAENEWLKRRTVTSYHTLTKAGNRSARVDRPKMKYFAVCRSKSKPKRETCGVWESLGQQDTGIATAMMRNRSHFVEKVDCIIVERKII